MHQCKGDEFDDVYLCGWAEGVFPHPLSVSSGTVDEERRLAYVALTRARQRAVITYQTTERIAHFGPFGERKFVTSQVKPSRFLYELMSRNQTRQGGRSPPQQKDIKWGDEYGFKYAVAGKDLPPHFAKSYQVPEGFRPGHRGNRKRQKVDTVNAELQGDTATATATPTSGVSGPRRAEVRAEDVIVPTDLVIEDEPQSESENNRQSDKETAKGGKHLLGLIQHSLVEMSDLRIKGSCKLYTDTFKQMLKDFGISRGVALVFVDKERSDSTSIDELINASDDEVTTKALSRCTAKELGHFLAYLIQSVDTVDE